MSKRFFIYVVLAFLFVGGGAGGATGVEAPFSDTISLVQKGDDFMVNYQLHIEPESSFWVAVRDAMRAGRQVQVTHQVRMNEADSLLSSYIAKKTWKKYLSYNLFENTYSYGSDPENLAQTTRLDIVQSFAFGISNQPLVAVQDLERAQVYDIRVHLQVSEEGADEGLLGYLPFGGLFKRKLTRYFTHVAR